MSELAKQIDDLKSFTPARLDLRRAGVSPTTAERLSLAADHALAKDAVRLPLDVIRLDQDLQSSGIRSIAVRSRAGNLETHLLRPDLGRTLDEDSLATLTGSRPIAYIVADGLSAGAVERYAVRLLVSLGEVRDVVVARHGRVAIGDEIGEALAAELAVVLIGERPGLTAPESLGAYVTYAPRRGRTDAERYCLSNIRDGGTPPETAAEQLRGLISRARAEKRTGV